MYDRLLAETIRLGRRSVLLLGPRQVGKSTLLQSLEPDLSLNLASPSTYRDYVAAPERLEHELAAAPRSVRLVFIDEVQRIPPLLDAVQVVLDEQPKRFRFLLSGSSARKLRRGQANLLPGRVHMHFLHPLVASELGRAFSLDRVLAHGTLPGIYAEEDSQVRAEDLRAYADTYLREEIQAESLVRNIGGYARLLDLVAAASGRIVNISSLARDAGIGFETVRRYLEVMEDTLLMFRIPAWSGSDRASLLAHPKLYLFDVGVRNAILRRPLDQFLTDERGLLLEHYVAQELNARRGSLWPEMSLFHYHTRHGAEVDFVLQIGRDFWAVEVKASRNVVKSALTGLASFASRAPRLRRKIVVYLGQRKQQIDDIEILPLRDFLAELPPLMT
jgi:predicted AAA+ superfamily ATPase